MMVSVRQVGRFAVKGYAHATAQGLQVAQRSQCLGRAGIATPRADFDRDRNELHSLWIDGPTGRGLFLSLASISEPGQLGRHGELLKRAVGPLAELRRLPPDGLDLPLLDIFAKVDPRLENSARISGRLLHAGSQCRREIAVAWTPPGHNVVVHGDYHLGQLIFERQSLTVWLLDLDDMALGPAEFDVANFAAHFVTSRRFYTGDVLNGFRVLAEFLWRSHCACPDPLDTRILNLCGAAALLRRALKMAERHESEAKLLEWIEAARQLAN